MSPRKNQVRPADPYAPIAGLYDFTYDQFTEDVEFYENLAQAVDGPILELGAGTGRVAIRLAEAGYAVTGIDTSASMLARGWQNLAEAAIPEGASCDLLEADMTTFDLGRQFSLVIVAANTLQHLLTTRDQRACFERVRAHLQPGGMFSFSVRSPASVDWDDDAQTPLLFEWARTDPGSGDTIMKFVAGHADAARQVKQWTYVYDRIGADGSVRRAVFPAELRYSSQAELTLLLQECGFRVTHVYGDYDLSPVGQGDNLVFVARAEEPR